MRRYRRSPRIRFRTAPHPSQGQPRSLCGDGFRCGRQHPAFIGPLERGTIRGLPDGNPRRPNGRDTRSTRGRSGYSRRSTRANGRRRPALTAQLAAKPGPGLHGPRPSRAEDQADRKRPPLSRHGKRGGAAPANNTVVIDISAKGPDGVSELPQLAATQLHVRLASLFPGLAEGLQLMALGAKAKFISAGTHLWRRKVAGRGRSRHPHLDRRRTRGHFAAISPSSHAPETIHSPGQNDRGPRGSHLPSARPPPSSIAGRLPSGSWPESRSPLMTLGSPSSGFRAGEFFMGDEHQGPVATCASPRGIGWENTT